MSPLRVEKYCQVSLQVASSQVNEWILTEILSQNSAEDLYCCTADTANAAWNLKQLQMSRPQSLSKGCLCRCWRITLWHKPPSGDCHGWVMWRDFGISAEWEAVGAWPWLPNSHTNSWLHRWEDGEMVDENWSHREGIWELLPFPWQSNASLSCWCWARQGWGCVSHPCVLTLLLSSCFTIPVSTDFCWLQISMSVVSLELTKGLSRFVKFYMLSGCTTWLNPNIERILYLFNM